MAKAFKMINARFLIYAGLLENLGKLTLTFTKPEMNSFYHIKTEPILPVALFVNALTQNTLSSNLGEDMLSAVARGLDVQK
jgi:hypothetical protein